MQSFVKRLATRLNTQQPNISYNAHRIFYTHSAKPSQQLDLGHHISSSSSSSSSVIHQWSSHHTLSSKIHACLSQSMVVRRFALSSRNAIFAKSLQYCRPWLPRVHFQRQSFNFSQNYDFDRRGWLAASSFLKSWFRRLTPNDMVFGLIIANVAIFLLWRIADEKFMINNFTISLGNIKSGRLHTLITNAFSHIDSWHIMSNMFGLYFFGMNIGRSFGPEFLLKLYLAGALGGSLFYIAHQSYKAQKGWGNPSKAMGASGAVNAIMLLDIFLFPKATIYLDFFIPVPAMLLGIFMIGKDMLRIIEGDTRISGAAHLGGAAVAAVAWAGVRRGRGF